MKIELKKPKCFGRMHLPEAKRCRKCYFFGKCYDKTFLTDENK